MIRNSMTHYAGLGIVGLMAAGQAVAGCRIPTSGYSQASGRSAPSTYQGGGAFIRTAYESGDQGNQQAAIVGLWKFEMKVNGNIIDFGTVEWHDDGTEMTISGGRNPSDGDTCMGAWQQVGWSKFKLNHIAMAYAGGAYLGVAHFHELITVDPTGQSYSGTFTIEQFADSTSDPFNESGAPLATVGGTVTATRVTPGN